MAEQTDKKNKDIWDKIEIVSKVIIAMIVPIASFATIFITEDITRQQSAPAAIDLASKILSGPKCKEPRTEGFEYCRDQDNYDFALYLINRYTEYDTSRFPQKAEDANSIGGYALCVEECRRDPDGFTCKNICGGLPE